MDLAYNAVKIEQKCSVLRSLTITRPPKGNNTLLNQTMKFQLPLAEYMWKDVVAFKYYGSQAGKLLVIVRALNA